MSMSSRTPEEFVFLCINLKSSTVRRSRMEALALDVGIDLQLIEGVTASDSNLDQDKRRYNVWKRRQRYATDLSPAELACVHSHAKALEAFLASNARYAVVLEDNAEFLDRFPDFFDGLDLGQAEFDLIRLEIRKHCHLNLTVHRHRKFRLTLSPRTSAGSTVNIYSRGGARKVLESLGSFYHAYDTHVGRFWMHDLRVLTCLPAIVVRARDVPSDIDLQDLAIGAQSRHVVATPQLGELWMRNRIDRGIGQVRKYFAIFAYYASTNRLG